MRPLNKVLAAILLQIPKDYALGNSLFNDLFKLYVLVDQVDVLDGWNIVGYLLNKNIQEHPEIVGLPWEETIRGIFNAQLDYQEFLTPELLDA